MRAGGRCRKAIGGVLVCLAALGCEAASPGEGARVQGAAGEGALLLPARFNLDRDVAALAASERFTLAPAPSGAYYSYLRLREGASDAQLRELLQHFSPVARAYAFQALADRYPGSSLFAELSLALRDLAPIATSEPHGGETTVADLALERVQHRLAGPERDVIAKQLLSTGAPARFVARMKREWTFGAELHEPLRALARAGDGDAFRALARYRDPADVALLLDGLREPTAEQALQAIAEFPDARFVGPLQAFQRALLELPSEPKTGFELPWLPPASWRELRDPNPQLLCQFYATALRFPPREAEAFFAAPFAREVHTADASAHLTCQRWVLSPELLRQHPEAGFRLWEREGALAIAQVQALSALDPARARRLFVSMAPALSRSAPEAATWVLRQTTGEERAAALQGLRTALRRAEKKELDNLADVVHGLQWRELLPELFARLESSRPLPDASMATFQGEVTRSLVWQLSRWQLSEPERQRLLSWVVGGRTARERETKDPIGQRIVEDYLVEVLTRARLLKPS